MKKLLFFVLLFGVKQTDAQIISTVAGNGTNGFSGDGGPATAAQIPYPWAGTFDASGNIYIVEQGYYAVRKINTSGIITTIAGIGSAGYTGDGGQATAASFNLPWAIAIDAGGNVYISDDQNHAIRKINTSGIISTVAGTGTIGFSGDGGQATSAQLNYPNGIVLDALGNLYIADGGNNCIRKVNTAGIISTIAGNGSTGFSGDGGQATLAGMWNPDALAIDGAGNLYTSTGNSRVRMINTSGVISTVVGNGTTGFGGDGGQATAAAIGNNILGITVDASGNLYFADTHYNRIRKVNTAGIIATIAGTGTAAYGGDGGYANYAELNEPAGIFLDVTGNLFITDSYNFRIRKVTNVMPDTNEAGIKSAAITSPCNDTVVSAVVTLGNYGTNLLTSCIINYQMDTGPIQTYTWTGTLTSGQSTVVNLPGFISTVGGHWLTCNCSKPNNVANSTFVAGSSFAIFFIALGANLPVIEGFEPPTCPSGFLPNSNWNSFYSLTSGAKFQITSNAAATGSQSCMLDNINNLGGNNSILQTVSYYDMTTLTTPLLTFKAAYQQKATTNADKLQIFTSTDCGNTWVSRKVISSSILATLAGGTGASAYIPTPAQFTTYTVNINGVASSQDVMFRWEFLADPNGPGNNLYIDDINIVDAAVGIQNFENTIDLNIFPNPSVNHLTIQSSTELDVISIYNSFGEKVKEVRTKTKEARVEIDISNLPAGVYTLLAQGRYSKIIKE